MSTLPSKRRCWNFLIDKEKNWDILLIMILKKHEIKYIKPKEERRLSTGETFEVKDDLGLVIDSSPSREEKKVSQRAETFALYKPKVLRKKMEIFAMGKTESIPVDVGFVLRW